ncbi:MAG: acetyl-CoA carboxylase, biotin carboxyl carrier protein, partial [Acidobacteriaceae bacterium]
MNAEDMNELKELIEFLKENKIGEFDLERGDLKVRIKFAQEGGADLAGLARMLQAQAAAAPATAAISAPVSGTATAIHASAGAAAAEAPAAEDTDAGLHIVKSPIVGTFYESP